MSVKNEFIKNLKSELKKRIDSNAHYSLRAFARDLDIEPSLLSKILRDQYSITENMVRRLSVGLGKSPDEIENLAQKIIHERLENRRAHARQSGSFQCIQSDHFEYLSEWYYMAILHLIETVDFKPDPQWCAERLSLSVQEVDEAFERLLRLGYIEKTEGVFYVRQPQYSTLNFPNTSVYLRKMQRQVLEKAIEAMEEVPFDLRHQSTLTFAVDANLIPKMVKEINSFRRNMNTLCSAESKVFNEVYHLSFSLYPVTTRGKS